MRQQIEARSRGHLRSDGDGAPGAHGPGDELPPPYGRLFPDLAAGPPTAPVGAGRDPDADPQPADHGPNPADLDPDRAPGAARRPGDRVVGRVGGHDGFGGLVAHDLGIVADPPAGVLPSAAAGPPRLTLDGLYGPGPLDAPHLYDPSDRARLRAPAPDDAGPRHELAGLHNALVDEVRAGGLVFWPVVFSEARRRVVHRYQRKVLDELLPRWVGRPLVEAIRRHGRRSYRPVDAAFVPLELLALAPWLVPAQAPARPCPAAWTLPEGRAVARALGVAPLVPTDLDPGAPLDDYVRAESRLVAGGRRLGPVGGRILAEVVVGVLELDVDSCLGPLAPVAPVAPAAGPAAPVSRTPSLPPSPAPGPRSSPRPASS